MEKWKEELYKLYPQPAEPSSFWEMGMKGVEAFIEKVRQEAIMEVIDEIPDSVDFSNPTMGKTHIKDQLKSKFANKI